MKPSTIVLLGAVGLGAAYFMLRSKKTVAVRAANRALAPSGVMLPTSGPDEFVSVVPSPLGPAAAGMKWTNVGGQWVQMPESMG